MKFVVRTFVFAVAALTLVTTAAEAQRGPGGGGRGGGFHGGGRPGGGFGGGGFHGGGRPGGGGWHRGGGFNRGPVFGGGFGSGFNRGGVYYPGGYGSCTFGDCYGRTDTYVGGGVGCAPATFEGNVTATDKILKSLVASKDFSSATEFKAQVSKISSLKDPAAKATAYMNMAGIDANNNAQIVEFVGARNAKGAWITDLQRNVGLTNAQAETVASKLQGALRGNLQ